MWKFWTYPYFWSACHSTIQFSFKIDVKFWFSLFFIIETYKNAKSKIFDFFFLLIEYWDITFISILILSTIKRKMKLCRNFAFLTMLQSVAWLSFFCFRRKSKNLKFKIKLIGIRNLPPPSPSPSFQICFIVWRLKSRYGYITRSSMLQYEV